MSFRRLVIVIFVVLVCLIANGPTFEIDRPDSQSRSDVPNRTLIARPLIKLGSRAKAQPKKVANTSAEDRAALEQELEEFVGETIETTSPDDAFLDSLFANIEQDGDASQFPFSRGWQLGASGGSFAGTNSGSGLGSSGDGASSSAIKSSGSAAGGRAGSSGPGNGGGASSDDNGLNPGGGIGSDDLVDSGRAPSFDDGDLGTDVAGILPTPVIPPNGSPTAPGGNGGGGSLTDDLVDIGPISLGQSGGDAPGISVGDSLAGGGLGNGGLIGGGIIGDGIIGGGLGGDDPFGKPFMPPELDAINDIVSNLPPLPSLGLDPMNPIPPGDSARLPSISNSTGDSDERNAIVATPEPGSIAIWSGGLFCMALGRRLLRRKNM